MQDINKTSLSFWRLNQKGKNKVNRALKRITGRYLDMKPFNE